MLRPTASYEPIYVTDDPRESVIALSRHGECIAVGRRLLLAGERDRHIPTITIPKGEWTCRLSGSRISAGPIAVSAEASRLIGMIVTELVLNAFRDTAHLFPLRLKSQG